MLDFIIQTQINFLKWINRGGLGIFDSDFYYLVWLIELIEKFSNVPMDLAYATLIGASEVKGISKIVCIDSDFYFYPDVPE